MIEARRPFHAISVHDATNDDRGGGPWHVDGRRRVGESVLRTPRRLPASGLSPQRRSRYAPGTREDARYRKLVGRMYSIPWPRAGAGPQSLLRRGSATASHG